MTNQKHYNKDYFNWQKKVGLFGAEANKIKFESLISNGQKVLDFGCGGGYLLSTYENIEKYGVEINESAIEDAISNKLNIYKSSKDLPENFFDLIISNNALEHCDNPLVELKELHRSLKKGSKICIVVPCDNIKSKYFEKDPHQHLYSWSPANLGNILSVAGFKILETKPFLYKWFPYRYKLKKYMNWKIFHFLCKIWAKIDNTSYQIRAIAEK
jgi:SAM-dependent methyltransferase